uniref:Uncharacterized protein n=1 Tax=Cannabis sativa TaxID=3483 RepID=A0A803PCU4_CANSA
MTVDPNVCILATTRIFMNPIDVANTAISAGIINLATTVGQVDTTNLVGLNGQPLLPREDLPLVPRNEGMSNVEQPPSTMTRSGPQYYAGDMEPKIRDQTIGEPHVDMGEDPELARLREAIY